MNGRPVPHEHPTGAQLDLSDVFPGAEGISAGILNSLGMLRRIRRNQERG